MNSRVALRAVSSVSAHHLNRKHHGLLNLPYKGSRYRVACDKRWAEAGARHDGAFAVNRGAWRAGEINGGAVATAIEAARRPAI